MKAFDGIDYEEQAKNGKKWCYDCEHYVYYGWGDCKCCIHGFMGVGQTKLHPDESADTCKEYSRKKGEPWYKNYGKRGRGK